MLINPCSKARWPERIPQTVAATAAGPGSRHSNINTCFLKSNGGYPRHMSGIQPAFRCSNYPQRTNVSGNAVRRIDTPRFLEGDTVLLASRSFGTRSHDFLATTHCIVSRGLAGSMTKRKVYAGLAADHGIDEFTSKSHGGVRRSMEENGTSKSSLDPPHHGESDRQILMCWFETEVTQLVRAFTSQLKLFFYQRYFHD